MGSGIAGNAAAYMLRDHFEVRVRRNPTIERYVEICLFVLKIGSVSVVVVSGMLFLQ